MENSIREFRNVNIDDPVKLPADLLLRAKQDGFSDRQIAYLLHSKEEKVREARKKQNKKAVYKLVDTCAGEHNAKKPYFYSTYESQDESRATANRKVVILGGGPNRIGQGIEFDYCCCHAAYALKEEGIESVYGQLQPGKQCLPITILRTGCISSR
jgi:carbamoyl-phosphate synthase large subunit